MEIGTYFLIKGYSFYLKHLSFSMDLSLKMLKRQSKSVAKLWEFVDYPVQTCAISFLPFSPPSKE